jgi:hypothetical protein
MALLPVLLLRPPSLASSAFGPNISLALGKSGNDRLSVPNCRMTWAKLADRATRPRAKADHVVVPQTFPPTNGAIIEGQANSMVKPWLPPKRGDKQVQG